MDSLNDARSALEFPTTCFSNFSSLSWFLFFLYCVDDTIIVVVWVDGVGVDGMISFGQDSVALARIWF